MKRRSILAIAATLPVVCASLALGITLATSASPEPRPTGPIAAATIEGSPAAEPTIEPTLTPEPTPEPTPELTPEPAPGGQATETPAPTPPPSPSPARETGVLREVRVMAGTEPDVSAGPLGTGLVAVVSQNVLGGCARPAVSVSHDAAATWSAATYPWRGCQDKHAVIAWGPGHGPGSSRLWAANAVGLTDGMSLSITYSDDYGATWAKQSVPRVTPSWVGAYPTIAVDNNPLSPNYGVVYVAYNWLASPSSVGVAVLASRDGRNWWHAEVPLASMKDYPNAWRFGYRLAVAPDGTVFVSFYEGDMKFWNSNDMWEIGEPSNTGRAGYAISRVTFAGSPRRLVAGAPIWVANVGVSTSAMFDPECQSQLAADAGGLWLVIADRPAGGGVVKAGHSFDGGKTWTWTTLRIGGQESFKPSLAMSGDRVFVGWHAVAKDGQVRTVYSTSAAVAPAFGPAAPVTPSSFTMPRIINGTGLRESATAADGIVYYAWGDARADLAIYVAAISI